MYDYFSAQPTSGDIPDLNFHKDDVMEVLKE